MRGSILGSNKIFFSTPKRQDKLWGSPRIVGVELLVPRLRMSGAISRLSLYALTWRGTTFLSAF